ncbi:hypothetical protein BOTBODRAFT_36572 [Botryobasidium botryosum FD-172 SS1]|uniref:Uncharacterized protein n=1 Tax=Botryobasidium botryosum (strain FD-172 SS1) TaxID=930990 RepID=A0A067M3J0_BOTB1|nr:hypothetical protein BOTBODRAFT_36572 [Botryobasidium botryosum FD-172 SS1]
MALKKAKASKKGNTTSKASDSKKTAKSNARGAAPSKPKDTRDAPDGPADSEESDHEPRVENPSTDICHDLKEIFSAVKSFQGSYYFVKQCDDAPNPTLRLTAGNIGTVGLPLVEVAAKKIIAHSKQVLFAPEERLAVGKKVRDTWEMDGEFVNFDSPKWNSFILDLAAQACRGLGIDFLASKPKVELYKLLLHGTGSHFLPRQYTEKAEGVFATMTVILPSAFTGGTVYLLHAGLPAVIKSSVDSLTSTSVTAWYTGVTHELKPVTSGYRLALSYNLIHTTNAPRPSLPAAYGPLVQLRHVLLSWKQGGGSGPRKIVYLLKSIYSAASLRDSKSTDAHIASFLGAVTGELGFSFGLARAQLTLSDPDLEKSMKITNLVDLEGRAISGEVLIDKEKGGETIPADLAGALRDGGYHEHISNGRREGRWQRYREGSVLVIWPSIRDTEIAYGSEYLGHALGSLRAATSTKPSREALQFVEDALASRHSDVDPSQVLRTVCAAACQWGDSKLWHRAMQICGGYDDLERLGLDDIMDAVAKFGYDDVLPSIEKMLQKDKSNTRRLKLLEEIESEVKANDDSSLDGWIAKSRETVLESLGPLVAGEDKLLIEIVKAPGGITALKQKIVPRVESNSKPEDLLSLVFALHAEQIKEGSCFKSSADKKIGCRMKTHLLLHAIRHADFFELVRSPSVKDPFMPNCWRTPPHAPSTKLTVQYLEACLSTDSESLIEDIVEQLLKGPSTTRNTKPTTEQRNSVLIKLVPYFGKMVEERSANMPPLPPSTIDLFYETTIPLLLAEMPRAVFKEDAVTSVVRAAAISGGVELLEQSILPEFKAVGPGAYLYKRFIQQLRAHEAQFAAKPSPTSSILDIVTDLVKTMINRLNLTKTATATMDMLEYCYEAGCGPCYADVLSKIVNDETLKADSIESFLLPLIPNLVGFASRHSISMAAPPLVSYFRAVISAWIRGILGSKPPANSALLACAQKITCECSFCPEIVKFLSSCTEQTLHLSGVKATGIKHLEKILGYARIHTVAHCSTMMTVPRGFKITKTNAAHQASRWKINQRKGISTLKSISTGENVLAAVFGTSYNNLLLQLGVPRINTAVSAEPGSANSTARPSARLKSATTAAHARRLSARPAPEYEDTKSSKRRKVDHANEIVDLT